MSEDKQKVKSGYSADNLQLVEGLDHVRKRPGMYIGSTGAKGLHHLIEEIVANSVDEAMAGYCTEITVKVDEDGWCTVTDNGRGIPVDIHKETGMSGLELVLTRLGGGGKWNQEGSGYKVSGGLHGVGSSVVNAVSTQMKAVVERDGFEWKQDYKMGVPTDQIKKGKKSSGHGTSISWLFDKNIFEKGIEYERVVIEKRLRELAYLNPGLIFNLQFHGHKDETFVAEGGLADYMKHLVADRDNIEAVHKQPVVITAEDDENGVYVDAAFYWTTAQQELAYSFVNAINTYEGGTHLQGARSAIRKSLNDAGNQLGKFRAKDEPFSQDDTREGLFYAVAVRISEPQFEGQTKIKLGNPEAMKAVEKLASEALTTFLTTKTNKAEAEKIIQRVVEARDGRLAAKKAKDAVSNRKGLLGGAGLPGKLSDCKSKNVAETEIFIVEGDSAGGGLVEQRDNNTQAVLPLRGKILNAEKAGEASLAADGIKDLLAALGGQVTSIKVPVTKGGRTVNKTKLIVDLSQPRYGKVIFCTDADVDGGHIATLLMTFFLRYAPDMIRNGSLYIADLPLYRVEHKTKGRLYIQTDEELQKYMKEGKLKTRADGEIDIQRFKGLGEMMPPQLAELALHHETRTLRRITIEDFGEAEEMTSLLMGSRVEPRKEYIQEHALNVKDKI